MALRKFLSGVKWLAINLLYFIWTNKKLTNNPLKKKIVYFDLKNNLYDRYLGIFMLFLHHNDYNIQVRFRPGFFAAWSTSLINLFNCPYQIVLKKPEKIDLGFTDQANKKGLFRLHYDYFQPATIENFHVPMCMVDTMYIKGYYKQDFRGEAERKRRIKIFFAGRFNEKAYNNPLLKSHFGLLTRKELFSATQKQLDKRYFTPQKKEDLFNTKEYEAILVNRDIYNVPAERLRNILAESDFFLAFPGVVMPLCHNIVEAMSAGCIPILQFKHWLFPPLEHGINCLAFNTAEEYKTTLELALTMNEAEKRKLRLNVFKYYYKHLSPSAVIQCIEKLNDRKEFRTILLNAEYQSVRIMNPGV